MKTSANFTSIIITAITLITTLSSCSKQTPGELAPLRSMNGAGRGAGIAAQERLEMERNWEPEARHVQQPGGIQALDNVGREHMAPEGLKPLASPGTDFARGGRLDSTTPVVGSTHMGRERTNGRPSVEWVSGNPGQRPQVVDGFTLLQEDEEHRPEDPTTRSVLGAGRARTAVHSVARVGR